MFGSKKRKRRRMLDRVVPRIKNRNFPRAIQAFARQARAADLAPVVRPLVGELLVAYATGHRGAPR